MKDKLKSLLIWLLEYLLTDVLLSIIRLAVFGLSLLCAYLILLGILVAYIRVFHPELVADYDLGVLLVWLGFTTAFWLGKSKIEHSMDENREIEREAFETLPEVQRQLSTTQQDLKLYKDFFADEKENVKKQDAIIKYEQNNAYVAKQQYRREAIDRMRLEKELESVNARLNQENIRRKQLEALNGTKPEQPLTDNTTNTTPATPTHFPNNNPKTSNDTRLEGEL